MIQKLYVHNYRCLENFELKLKDMPSALLIGKNGTGKSTVAAALEIFQSIGRGVNRVGELVRPFDSARSRADVPIRFEIEILLAGQLYEYQLALELPERFRELRVLEETLIVSGKPVYSRQEAQVTLHISEQNRDAQFSVDWHLVALPVIQVQSENDPLHVFRTWLARMIIISPIPTQMTGDSQGETLELLRDVSNFGEWFTGVLSRYPAAYAHVDQYLRAVMPDIQDVLNEPVGKDARSMVVRFAANQANLRVEFGHLSDGEKCFFICATVLAANKSYGPLFCFWDEPDSYLSLSEVGHFIVSLRRSFASQGQFLATSHNGEAIRRFGYENTFVLDRKSHLEPTLIRRLSELSLEGDLIETLIRGDLEL